MFRCGNRRLHVAIGRYLPNQVPQGCNLCDSQEPGDEFHSLFNCPSFSNERRIFIKKCYDVRPNVLSMSKMFNTANTKELKNLSRFCKVIMSEF